jgi:hypothetical protein
MTIRNLDAFIAGIWDWAILNGCFGSTRIAPTDIDGMVERNGQFLVLEAKGPGVPLTKGQSLTLASLQRTGLFTVIVVWGNPGQPEKIRVMTPKKTIDVNPADLTTLRGWVANWFMYAERHQLEARSSRAI